MTIGAAQQFFLGASKATGGGGAGYQIERSLRFNSSDSAFLSRVPVGVGTSLTTSTMSMWVKRSALGVNFPLFSAGTDTSDYLIAHFQTDDTIRIVTGENGATNQNLVVTAAVFRDTSAWYHIVVQFDFTNATSTDRIKLYVNGARVTLSGTFAAQNYTGTRFNRAFDHSIGKWSNSTAYFSGFIAEVFFIDGQALTPSSFTEVSATTGQLVPKAYTGSFGTNGFKLTFSDNSNNTATTLGKDYSGNSNNWTPNNLSVTAGAGNDSLVDTPTSYGTDTGAGGEVRGNYCTLNPLSGLPASRTLSDGNLQLTTTTGGSTFGTSLGTIAVSSGKWYFELTCGSYITYSDWAFGIAPPDFKNPTDAGSYVYMGYDGTKYGNGSPSAYGASYTTGDVIGCAFNADGGTLTFYKNGVSQGQAFSGITGTYAPIIGDTGSGSMVAYLNFGQRAFAYTAPSGFKALCDTNLTSTTITTSGSYTGNGTADGPFVYLNGVPTAMTIGGNAVTFGTHADKLSNGFKIRTSSTTYNQNASSYSYSITSTGAAFKNARAQPNP